MNASEDPLAHEFRHGAETRGELRELTPWAG